MKDYCFYSCYDDSYKTLGDGCIKSIKKFYPDANVFKFKPPRDNLFSLQSFCNFHLQKGKKLLEEYKRVISVDSDHIMCSDCPDIFGEFDMGVVQNNIPVDETYGGIKDKIYINAGLSICTNKDTWQEWIDEYNKRCMVNWEPLHEQNALNYIFHNSKSNIKLLEFPDRTYGIAQGDYYHQMVLKDNELYIQWKDFRGEDKEKKICLFHAAGEFYKTNGHINYDLITNIEAKEKLKGFTL
jgi:hypothetical protein